MVSREKWIETGYLLFAHEGADGLQIERMARILKLNKSGFYHYFGTLEVFHERLLSHHIKYVELFAADITQCHDFVTDFLPLLMRHRLAAMVQVQHKRKNKDLLGSAIIKSDQLIGLAVLPIWMKHIEIHGNENLAFRYWCLVRDGFYQRVELKSSWYSDLHQHALDVKEVAQLLALGSITRFESKINGAV